MDNHASGFVQAATGGTGALAGRIGPNAITRVAEALRETVGAVTTSALFARAGLARHLAHPPEAMVEEREVAHLQQRLRHELGTHLARHVCELAGYKTGSYLLAHRIPRGAQTLLRCLPAPMAAHFFTRAIRRHAWTFAGSGTFAARAGNPWRLSITGNPLCAAFRADVPACHFYRATFERLFRALVASEARVTEVQCEACGDDACVFEVRW